MSKLHDIGRCTEVAIYPERATAGGAAATAGAGAAAATAGATTAGGGGHWWWPYFIAALVNTEQFCRGMEGPHPPAGQPHVGF